MERFSKAYISGLVVFLLFLAIACNSKEESYDTGSYRFDRSVIDKIPAYDSLAQLILKNFRPLSTNIQEHYFYYTRTMDTASLHGVLPVRQVLHYMDLIGENYIYRFDVFKDSSIKFYLRDTYLDEHKLHIRERLSYVPTGNIQPRKEPIRDTIIGQNWQYWVSFDKKGFELF